MWNICKTNEFMYTHMVQSFSLTFFRSPLSPICLHFPLSCLRFPLHVLFSLLLFISSLSLSFFSLFLSIPASCLLSHFLSSYFFCHAFSHNLSLFLLTVSLTFSLARNRHNSLFLCFSSALLSFSLSYLLCPKYSAKLQL